jgi:hypothetical protein
MDGLMTITADQLRQIQDKSVRQSVSNALDEVERFRHFAANAAMQLEHAAKLRIGQMDSQSRVDEVHAQIRQALVSVAEQARSML